MPERDGLIARVRQIRRLTTKAAGPTDLSSSPDPARGLEARVEHLEQLVQGLQDSVHRESARHAKRISEIEAQIQPSVLGKALNEDARTRGL